jgi:hypothetical protein
MSDNLILGLNSGQNTPCLTKSTLVGNYAGQNDTAGYSNIYLGHSAGKNSQLSHNNIFIGSDTGGQQIGNTNIYIGNDTGFISNGSNNILIGDNLSCIGSNKLAIGSSSSNGHSLIEGETSEGSKQVNIDSPLNLNGDLTTTSVVLNVYQNTNQITNPVHGQTIIKNDGSNTSICVYINNAWVNLASTTY